MGLPANISYGTVVGQYIASLADSSDVDKLPEGVAMTGTITFLASAPYVVDSTATPNPVTVVKTQIVCPLDSEGYLCSPYVAADSPLSRGVMLVATDDPDLNPVGWNWQVIYNLRDPLGNVVSIPTHALQVPTGATIDLTSAIPVPASGGTFITKGDKGDTGPVGPANTLTIGGVTTGAAGSAATATITGAAPAQVLTFTIPRGDTGATGATGAAGNVTQTIDTLGAIAVKRVNLATNPSWETTTGLVNVRTNLITNPAAEVNVTTGWTPNASTVTRDTTWFASGAASFKIVPNGAQAQSDFRAGSATTFPFGMAAGKTYTLSGTVRLEAAQTSGSLDTRARRVSLLYSTDGSTWNYNYGTQAPNAAGTFRSSITLAIPANATGVIVMIGNGSSLAADAVWWDELLLEEGSTLYPYFDGSTPAAGDFTYAWAGTVHGSASYQQAPGYGGLSNSVVSFKSGEWKNSRTGSVRIRPTSQTGNTDSFLAPGGDTGAKRYGMESGKTYTVSAMCRIDTVQTGVLGTKARSIRLFYRDGGTYYSVDSPQLPNTAGASQRLSVTATIPASATEIFVRLQNGATIDGGDVWFDDLLIEETSTLSPYFDGTTSGAYWSGTADASTSVIAALGRSDKDATKLLRGDGIWATGLNGTVLTTENLNTILTVGTYRQSQTSGVNATLENNYPYVGAYGTLHVMNTSIGGDIWQEFHPQTYNTTADGRVFYRRAYSNGNWSPWRTYASSRWDQTAGRAMYHWDTLNTREQLIYGDTGWRQVLSPGDIANMPNMQAYIRRVGHTVHFHAYETTAGGTASGATSLYVTPTGFRFVLGASPGMIAGSVIDSGALPISGASIYLASAGTYTVTLRAVSGVRHYATISWTTTDSWPTTLPGTAYGSIPNL